MSYIHLLPTVCNCMHKFEVFVMWDVERIKQLWGRKVWLKLILQVCFHSPCNLSVLCQASEHLFYRLNVWWWGSHLMPLLWDSTFSHICWVKLNQVRCIYRLRLILISNESYLAHLNLMFPSTKAVVAYKRFFFLLKWLFTHKDKRKYYE